MKGINALSYLLLFVGGGTGTICRFLITQLTLRLYPNLFPIGTFMINITGSFLIGFIGALFQSDHLTLQSKLFLMTGILGGFTTFSSYSLEVVQLIQLHKTFAVIGYIILTNILSICFCFLGFTLAGK